jgi:hypothetical protein
MEQGSEAPTARSDGITRKGSCERHSPRMGIRFADRSGCRQTEGTSLPAPGITGRRGTPPRLPARKLFDQRPRPTSVPHTVPRTTARTPHHTSHGLSTPSSRVSWLKRPRPAGCPPAYGPGSQVLPGAPLVAGARRLPARPPGPRTGWCAPRCTIWSVRHMTVSKIGAHSTPIADRVGDTMLQLAPSG